MIRRGAGNGGERLVVLIQFKKKKLILYTMPSSLLFFIFCLVCLMSPDPYFVLDIILWPALRILNLDDDYENELIVKVR